jgi:hypothetical protein
MKSLHVYDPALCCSSGVCGPSVDPVLVRVNADLEWLKSQSVVVERHNLAQQPLDFTTNPVVKARLQEEGQDVLPLVLLDGQVVAARFYPTRDQLATLCGVKTETASSCCDSGSGCCS